MNKLTNGVDFTGNVCGSGNTTEFPYLYWCGSGNDFVGFPTSLNLELPICVKECPKADEHQEYCPGSPTSEQSGHEEDYGDLPYTLINTITQEVVKQASYPTTYMANRYCMPNTMVNMANVTAAKVLKEQLQTGPMSSKAFQFAQAAMALQNNYKLLIGMGFFLDLLVLCVLAFLADVCQAPCLWLPRGSERGRHRL
jgi:hypothetical protein